MSYDQIPDALAQDVKERLIADDPAAEPDDPAHLFALMEDNVRLRHAEGEPPAPRVVVLTGTARRVPGMDGTARVPVSIEIIESMDRSDDESHRGKVRIFSLWFWSLRALRGQEGVFTRTHLHDILVQHPASAIRATERERVTTLRGEFISTLLAGG